MKKLNLQSRINYLVFICIDFALYHHYICVQIYFLFLPYLLSFFISTCPNICQDLSDNKQSRMAESIEYTN